jgi:sterol desaturase/sphingolipid hydroxylase (fatty acid hydroxylase superfamily)
MPPVHVLIVLVLSGINLSSVALSWHITRPGIVLGRRVQVRTADRAALLERLPLVEANFLMLTAGACLTTWMFPDHFPTAFPGLLSLLLQVCFVVVFDDTWFYFLHRWMHEHKRTYNLIHRVHHRAFAPLPVDYLYVHPLEWMFGTVGPTLGLALLGLALGGVNAWVLLTYAVVRNSHEVLIHSGYRSAIAQRLPLFATVEHHDLHHSRPTLGNYASTLTFWDHLLGTFRREAT